MCFKQILKFSHLVLSNKYCFTVSMTCAAVLCNAFQYQCSLFPIFLLIFKHIEHYGPYCHRVSEEGKTLVLAKEHNAKLPYKHIYSFSYFHSPLNIPDAGLSSYCTPVSAPCDLAAFFCFYSSALSFRLLPPPPS